MVVRVWKAEFEKQGSHRLNQKVQTWTHIFT